MPDIANEGVRAVLERDDLNGDGGRGGGAHVRSRGEPRPGLRALSARGLRP